MEKLIYNVEDLADYGKETKERINKAVVASAIKIRDTIRSSFVSEARSLYKHHRGNIAHLTSGIMIGRDQGGTIKIHALGNKTDSSSYKTRFFIGGTRYRKQERRLGKPIKPFTKGFIKPTDSLVEVVSNSNSILTNYIKKAIDG